MPLDVWIQLLAVGAIAGATGQLARAIVGLAKVSREASAAGTVAGREFNASQLVVSLLVGATAGVLAALLMKEQIKPAAVELTTILGLMASGYAGTDFIEGAMGSLMPKAPQVPQAPAPGTLVSPYPVVLPSPATVLPQPVAVSQPLVVPQTAVSASPAAPVVNPQAVG